MAPASSRVEPARVSIAQAKTSFIKNWGPVVSQDMRPSSDLASHNPLRVPIMSNVSDIPCAFRTYDGVS